MPNYSILVVSKSEIPMQILKELLPKDQYNILFSSTIAQTQRFAHRTQDRFADH